MDSFKMREVMRILRMAISLVYFSLDWAIGSVETFFKWRRKGSLVVLYYHGVSSRERRKFARQMDLVARWATPVRADTPFAAEVNGPHVAVTFDDGFESVLKNAIPELKSRNIPSTLFVPTAFLGKAPAWRSKSEAIKGEETVIGTQAIRKLKDNDLVSIGSHCVTHRNLLSLTEKEVYGELSESKKRLEEVLGKEVQLMSFPFGGYNKKVLMLARQAGYTRVFSILPKRTIAGSREYVTGRVEVDPGDWNIEFWLKTNGAYRWLPLAFELKKILIHKKKSVHVV